jgi:hypothetical protein
MKRLVFAAALVALTGSCALVMVGSAGMAGAYGWSQGELSRNYRQPLAAAWEGVKHAVGALKLTVEEQEIKSHYGKIMASYPDKEEAITISLEKWTNVETRISVRVGLIGDRVKSEKIHEEIEKALR